MQIYRFIALSSILLITIPRRNVVQSCPVVVASVCKCRLEGANGISADCSQLTLTDAVKRLEEANLHVHRLEIHNNNNIRDIPAKIFAKIAMDHLDLSDNYISRVDPNAFLGQEGTLTSLSLANNTLSTVPSLASLRNLANLDLSGNLISTVRENVFVQNQRLKTLRFERNRICNLDPNSLNEVKSNLELLDLSNNCFSHVPASTLRNFQKLAYLDLSTNRINDVPNLQFMNMPSLKELRLNDNNIASVYPLAFMNVPNMERLILANNKLTSLDTGRFQSFDNLVDLDLSGNRLAKISTSSFSNMKSLKHISFDGNNISSVETLAFSSLPQLQLLSMQNNNIRQLFRNAFDSLPSMQVLLLANNALESLDSGMLSGMPVLQQLNLHYNRLANLSPNTFDPVPQLTTLDLSKNLIQNVSTDLFRKLNKLFWLDLSENKIQSFETGSFINKVSNMLLQGNPWQCDDKLDWFVRYLVANNVRTFLPGQSEVTCLGPPDYAGTLLKDLMIKKANETFFKTFGGAQGIFGNGLSNIPGLGSFLGGSGGGDLVGAAIGKAAGAGGLLDALATPVNGMIGAGVVTELMQSLPNIIASIPGQKGADGLPLLRTGADGQLPGIDFSKVPPSVIQYVMNGGQIPGISPDQMRRLIQQYVQQLAKTIPPVAEQPAPAPSATVPENGKNNKAEPAVTQTVPLPPLSSLPPDLVKNVMGGGLIPGLTKEQTESIKQHYIREWLAASANTSAPAPGSDVDILAGKLPNTGGNSTGNDWLTALPPEILRTIDMSRISPGVLADIAAGRVPDLSKVPPELVQVLINKRPDIFGRMVDQLLSNKIDQQQMSTIDGSILGRLPPTQQTPILVSGQPYDVNNLDNQADLSYFKYGNENNTGLWTGLGLGVVGIITTMTILFLCYKRRKSNQLKRRSIDSEVNSSAEDTDGTKFFSTPSRSAIATTTMGTMDAQQNHTLQQHNHSAAALHQPQQHLSSTLQQHNNNAKVAPLFFAGTPTLEHHSKSSISATSMLHKANLHRQHKQIDNANKNNSYHNPSNKGWSYLASSASYNNSTNSGSTPNFKKTEM